MKAKSFFAVLGIFAFLFVFGCSSSDDNSATNNPIGTNPLVQGAASGDGDEISADNDTTCESPGDPSQSDPGDHEDNSICPGTFVIWVHESDGVFDSTYQFRICNNGSKKNCTSWTTMDEFISCGIEWRAYFNDPTVSGSGSRTVQVRNGSGVKIGSDSFIVTTDCNQTND